MMIIVEMLGSFIGIFILAYIFTTFLPIIRRNLLIPLTLMFIAAFVFYIKDTDIDISRYRDIASFSKQIEQALHFDITRMLYWFLIFFLWLLIAGVLILLFELFMRERAKEILDGIENYLSLFGIRNILLIGCFVIPLAVFAGMYFRFMTTRMMFISTLCFITAQLEVLFSSAKRQTARIAEKNVFFLVGLSVLNVFLLFISLAVLLFKRI